MLNDEPADAALEGRELPMEAAVELATALVCDLARRSGLRALVIKGPTLTAQRIRDRRTSTDADVLVAPADYEQLVTLLASYGWRPRDGRVVAKALKEHSISLLHPQWPCDIDLHSFYPGLFGDPAEVFDFLWDHRENHRLAGTQIEAPSFLANGLIVWLHGARNPGSARHQGEMERVQQRFEELDERERQELLDLATTAKALSSAGDLLSTLGLQPGEDLTPDERREWEIYRTTIESGSAVQWLRAMQGAPGLQGKARVMYRGFWPSDLELRRIYVNREVTRPALVTYRLRRIQRGVRSLVDVARAASPGLRRLPPGVRVVINGRYLTQEVTGVQRFAEEITKELLELRDDVYVLAPRGRLRALPYGCSRELGFLSGHLWEQITLPLFLALNGSPLLVTLTSTGPALYGNQISTHHDIMYAKFPEGHTRAFRLVYSLLIPRLLKVSRGLITVSTFSAHEIAAHFKIDSSRFTVVPNAASSIFTEDPSVTRERFFLAVSSMKETKNFKRLVDAYRLLVEAGGDVPTLKIVGGSAGNFTDICLADVPGVECVGRVSDIELVDLYRHTLAFVFPSLYEGFGIPPLEAQSCGAPVIAARSSSLPEVLRESARWVDPLDVSDIKGAMAAVMSDQALACDLSRRGRDNVARFSWHRSALKVSMLINDLLP